MEFKAIKEKANIVNAKLRYLHRQKQIWYEKIIKAVNRSINNLTELEKLEKKKTLGGKYVSCEVVGNSCKFWGKHRNVMAGLFSSY